MSNLKLCTLLLFACCAMSMHAQDIRCGFDDRIAAIKQTSFYTDAIYAITDRANRHQIRGRAIKWIPVVVHDVNRTGVPLSHAQIVHQIDVMNQDFAGRGENVHKLLPEFASLAADTEIRFCLATTDPDGMPTNGVTFTETDIINIAQQRDGAGRYVVYYDVLGGKTGWDPQRYINIWVAEYGNGILGYGSLPGTAPFEEEIGIVMDRNFFGSIGSGSSTAQFDGGHSLTHEMGHFLGLLHIWGDDNESCTDSDEVDDTPNAAGPYFLCPSGAQHSCGESNMYQNFMDFTDDRCLAAFTHGQASRMHAALIAYYPLLTESDPCSNPISTDQWWNELVWSYDQSSDQYVLYHPDGFADDVSVDIFSLDGRLIMSADLHERQSYLFIHKYFIPGIYILRLSADDEEYVRKIGIY